jgi:hypothetical protein
MRTWKRLTQALSAPEPSDNVTQLKRLKGESYKCASSPLSLAIAVMSCGVNHSCRLTHRPIHCPWRTCFFSRTAPSGAGLGPFPQPRPAHCHSV